MRVLRAANPWLAVLAGWVLLFLAPPASAERYASIIVDAGSGRVVSSYDADSLRYPASLTKLMTLYLLFDAIDSKKVALDTELPVSRHAAAQPPTRLGVAPGETITVRTAIEALITRSANDVAVVVAEGLGGTEPDFAAMMRQKAQALGMTRTAFYNASGLPNPDQHTTARDLAVLARALIRNHARFYPYFSIEGFEYRGQWVPGHNGMLKRYPGADGLKTGYINASGYNLVSSAVQDGRRLIGVVLGEENPRARDIQMSRLFDAGFARDGGGEAGPAVATIPAIIERAAAEPAPHAVPAVARPRHAAVQHAVVVVRGSEARHAKPVRHARTAHDAKAPRHAHGKPAHVRERRPTRSAARTKAGATRVAKADQEWSVQVGAYTSHAAAERAAAKARREAGLKAGAAEVRVIATHPAKGKTVYRAQLASLDRPAAAHACRRLARADVDCMVARGPSGRRLAQAD